MVTGLIGSNLVSGEIYPDTSFSRTIKRATEEATKVIKRGLT